MIVQQYVDFNDEQPRESKASQGDLEGSNLDSTFNGASTKGLPLMHFQISSSSNLFW